MTLAYDSPVWFYALLVPVFASLAVLTFALAWAIWKDTNRDA